MYTIKIIAAVAGFLAVASSASADGFRYTGSPKLGQFYVYDQPQTDSRQARKSPLDAQAQMPEPTRFVRKGGIGSREP